MTAGEFDAIREYLYAETGIALGPNKRDLVASRLAKRLRALGLRSHGAYLRAVQSDDPPGERQRFINCLTTNKTDFFREPHHFAFLRDQVIPGLPGRRLRIWCAASSTGDEPYTLAMTVRDACPRSEGWDAKVLASDIDTQVLEHAARGVYDADRAGGVPPDLLRKYFRRGTGANAGKIATRPELRELLTFRQINLISDQWPVRGPLDVIFCRNVVIYFDRDTQDKLLKRFAALLRPGGYLFMGHSENITWLADTFAPLGGTVYQLRGGTDTPPPPARPPVPPGSAPPPTPRSEEEYSIILGEVRATRGPAVVKTLLGSCVAACLWDPETGVGGMNHFSLPGGADAGADARYGAYAMELLITAIMKKGGDRSRLRAKVFGGGKVLNVGAAGMNVGERNADFVLQFLQDEGIPVVAQSLGGSAGRQVRFRPHTGQAQVKPLPERQLQPIVAREADHGDQLRKSLQQPPEDDITLF